MIKESLKIHSSCQFEVKQHVYFDKNMKSMEYEVETFFFLPTALQINQYSYSASEFQRSIKNYVRLTPPTYKFHSIYEEEGLVDVLHQQLEDIYKQEIICIADYENLLKIFSLTLKRTLRLSAKSILKNPTKRDEEHIQEFLDSTKKSLEKYRSLAQICQKIQLKVVSQAYEYCDEYLSWVTTFYLRKIFKDKDLPLRNEISQLWYEEILYRKEHYPQSVKSSENSTEELSYRWNVIKKYVNHYLFLDIRHKKGNPILLHSLYGIAAALSMIFATMVAFMWQGKYGALSINLFYALVLGYILKDRIKEIGREQLYRLFRKWIPDRRLLIYREGIRKHIGVCKESFRFLEKSQLPEDVYNIREKSHAITLVNGVQIENVLAYKKEVILYHPPSLFERNRYPFADITRFNIIDFLRYADNSLEELPFIEEDETPVVGEKIYHIYVVRRYKIYDETANELVRLGINQQGIKHLEVLQSLKFKNDVVEDDE